MISYDDQEAFWRDDEDILDDQEPNWPVCSECQSENSFEFHLLKDFNVLCDSCYNKLIKDPGYHSCTK